MKRILVFLQGFGAPCIAVAIAVSSCGASAWAQTASAVVETDENGTKLQEIIVTAEKRTQNLEKAAVSATVLSGETLTEQNKTNIEEILEQIPGVQMQENLGGFVANIRGVTNNAGNSADNVTALYLDGVYSSQLPVENRAAFFDVNRVEVLRGPQGTLWGGNALGGAVSIVTNDPDLTKYSVSATANAGNYDALSGQAVVNMPLSSTVAVRAVVASEDRRGYLGNGQDDSVYNAARLKVLYQPSDELRLVVTALQTKVGGEGPGAIISPYPLSLTSQKDPWANAQPVIFNGSVITPTSPEKANSYRGNLDWTLGVGTMTFLPAYTTIDQVTVSSPGLTAHIQHTRTTGELRFTSRGDSALRWTVGTYYQHSNTPLHVDISAANVKTGQDYLRETQYAGFAQATYAITSAFRLTAGARYTSESHTELDFFVPRDAPVALTYPGSEKSSTTTWKAGFEADVAAESMFYGNVSTGFRAGGLVAGGNNPPAAVAPGTALPTFAPETLTAYVLGSKSTFLNDSAQLNAEAFYYHYDNYQVQSGNPLSGQTLEANAQGAREYGGEIESIYRVTAADKIDASLAYLHATFGRQTGGAGSTADPTSNNYIAYGSDIDHAPHWTARLGYEHRWAIPGGDLFAAADANYVTQEKIWFATNCHPDGTECWAPGHQVANAHLTYESVNGRWNATAYVRNIGNYPVINGVLPVSASTNGQETLYVSPPRTFGLTFTVKLDAPY